MLFLSVILAITWLQVWFFNEYQYERKKNINERVDKDYWKSLFTIWKGKKRWLAFLIILPFGILPSYNLMSPALIDSGWSLPEIAILLKLFGSIISLIAIFLSSKIVKKLTRRRSLVYSTGLHSCCLLSFIPISMGYNSPLLVYSAFFSII